MQQQDHPALGSSFGQPSQFATRHQLADVASTSEVGEEHPPHLPGRTGTARGEEDAFCELLTDGYLRTDEHGVIRKANHPAANLLGRELCWLDGKPLATLVDPAQRRSFRSLANALRSCSGAQQWTLRITPSTGEPRVVSAVIGPVYDATGESVGARWILRPVCDVALSPDEVGTAAFFADLTERASVLLASSLDADAALRGLARLVVPGLADLCLIDLVEHDGTLRRVAASGDASQYDDVLGTLTAHAPAAAAEPAAQAVREGDRVLVEDPPSEWLGEVARNEAQLDALERLKPRVWLAVPFIARGHVLGTLSLITADPRRMMTPRSIAVAEELARRVALCVDNARLYRLALRASEAKSAFLATISHELRTPLTAVLGYAELLRDGLAGELTPEQDDFVQRIRESGDHLLRLVEEVLNYARLEAREVPPELERIELGTLLNQAATLIRPLARARSLEFTVEHPSEEVWFLSDPTKTRQILVNLLANAVKFTDRGEVTLRSWVDGAAESPRVMFEVRDTGIGIPTELLPRIFDPFWQVEQTSRRARGGAGLGLSVVRQLALLLGGDVSAESTRGEGSCFMVWLPFRVPRAAPGVQDVVLAAS